MTLARDELLTVRPKAFQLLRYLAEHPKRPLTPFVPGFDNQASLLRKSLDGVVWDEPRSGDALLSEQLQQAGNANLTGEEPS